jgi:RNA polymerase sigma factor (sigma-70 family)
MVAPRFPLDLADPALRAALIKSLRPRVPAADVEDVVQATLAEAWAAPEARRPADAESARRWLWGIARHKVADLHRRGRRERLAVDGEEELSSPDTEPTGGVANDLGQSAEQARDATDLLRWAEEQLPAGEDVPQTFEWLLREGEGDKLEQIAEEAALPAPRVRQRVSRLRKHLRSRWALEVAAVAVLLGLVFLAYRYLRSVRNAPENERIVRETPTAPPTAPTPFELAERLREETFPLCAAGDRARCLEGLDRAKQLDPAGDTAPRVQAAREQVAPTPAPSASASALPPTLPTVTPPRRTTPVPTDTALPIPTAQPPRPTRLDATSAPPGPSKGTSRSLDSSSMK